MKLIDKLKLDLKNSIKNKLESDKSILRLILGETQRMSTKEISDEDILRILKQMVKKEKEILKLENKKSSYFIEFINKYLPKELTEDEIFKWINNNIDFNKYKNKMQSMKDIMNHYKGKVDGNIVKNILLKRIK